MKAIIANAVEAASQDMSWKAIDRYSQDYIELQTKDNVKFYKTPDAILKRQLEVYDEVAKKKAADNPLFKEIVESQLAFAKRATQWEQDTVVNRKMAFDHYFGPNAQEADLTVAAERQSTIRRRPDGALSLSIIRLRRAAMT